MSAPLGQGQPLLARQTATILLVSAFCTGVALAGGDPVAGKTVFANQCDRRLFTS